MDLSPIRPRLAKARQVNRDHHSGRGYYRGGWHPSSPPLPRPPVFRGQQPQQSWGTPGPLVGRKPIAKVSRLLDALKAVEYRNLEVFV